MWDFKTDGKIYSSPYVSDGLVYFGSNDRKIYCLDAVKGRKNMGIWKQEA